MSWVVAIAVVFVVVLKVLEYSTSYHDLVLQSLFFKNSPISVKFETLVKERRSIQEENKSISAQDNYAKWTKNNRKLDKLDKEITELGAQLKAHNEQIKGHLKKVKLLLLTVPFLCFKLWKGKHIVYNLPHHQMFPQLVAGVWSQGWLYLAILPLQLAKSIVTGSSFAIETASFPHMGVSLGIWLWALNNVISNIEFMTMQLWAKPVSKPSKKLEIVTDEIKVD